MATTTWNQDINAGTDWKAVIKLKDKDSNSRDIRGCTLASKVKRHYTSAAYQDIGILVTSAIAGQMDFTLTDAQTTIMKSGKYLYDVEMIGAPVLTVSNAASTFVMDEIITGGTTEATGKVILHDLAGNTIKYEVLTGTFAGTETIPGGTNAYTATMVSLKTGDTERVIAGVITVRPEVT